LRWGASQVFVMNERRMQSTSQPKVRGYLRSYCRITDGFNCWQPCCLPVSSLSTFSAVYARIKVNRREWRIFAARAEVWSISVLDLEVELKCELYDSSAVFVDDLPKVVKRFLTVMETTRWVADIICRITISFRHTILMNVTNGVEREIDVTPTQASCCIDLCRVGLIEYVEQASTELELLRLAEVEILKERDVKVAAARRPQVERRLRWSTVREARNCQLRKIEELRANASITASLWVA